MDICACLLPNGAIGDSRNANIVHFIDICSVKEYSLSSSNKQKLTNKIKSCQEYKDMKSKLVKRYEKGEKSPKDTIEFVKDVDLYYAIQHMSITLTYDSKEKKYKITMYDRYDFDSWRKIFSKTGISFANAANNLGLLMQKCGMMIPYDISDGKLISVRYYRRHRRHRKTPHLIMKCGEE